VVRRRAARRLTAPTVKFSDTKLANGLRVIISENHAAPVFSVALVRRRLARRAPGRTGFAHLFEHMMFKGSENVGPGEHFYTIFSNGGTMNGTTSKERTLYFETMPANQLDAALFLEADRMRSLAIVKDNLDNQRNAVQEERRLRVDNQPYGRADEEIEALAFDNFAYKHSVIGSMTDLNAASVEDVTAFFKTYYAPNNAILAIVGDLNSAATPRSAILSRFRRSRPRRRSTSRSRRRIANGASRSRIRWRPAAGRHRLSDPVHPLPDDDTIDVRPKLAGWRAGGSSSTSSASSSGRCRCAFAPNSRGPRFGIEATPPGTSVEALEQAIYSEIDGESRADCEPRSRRPARGPPAFMGAWRHRCRWRGPADTPCFCEPGGSTRGGTGSRSSAPPTSSASRAYFTPENRRSSSRFRKPPRRAGWRCAMKSGCWIALGALSPSHAGSDGRRQEPVFRRRRRPWVGSVRVFRRRSLRQRGLVRKGKVPVSNEILKITLPRPAETTLSNGLRLLVLEDRRLPQISSSC
jgi:hypothetical protein